MTTNPVESIEVIITECDVLLSLLSTSVLSILMPSFKPLIKILTEAEIYIAQSIYLAQGTPMSDHQQNTHMHVHPHTYIHACVRARTHTHLAHHLTHVKILINQL